jgi:hypothetical protein
MIKRVREKREIWRENQIKLQALAAETGGIFQAPEEFGTMLTLAIEIARAVDSQYVLTYMPKKPFTNSEKRDKRKVRVSTHCPGIEIQSREKLF